MRTHEQSKRCPVCALRETVISDEARQRETGGDVWSLTAKGRAVLAEMARHEQAEREAASWQRYFDVMETCA